MLTTGVTGVDASHAPEESPPAEASHRAVGRRRRPDAVTAAVVMSVVVFVLGGLGSSLLGRQVLADTGSLANNAPYRDGRMAGVQVHTVVQGDTIDSALPNEVLFGESLRRGEFASWNPYAVGGAPLGASTNAGIAAPTMLPFWVLPGWLAPAYAKLLELLVAIGGTYLFLRRVRLGRAASVLGGLVFGSSAFLMVWTNWPQSRVACLIPVLFWALERLAQRLRLREVAVLALAVSAMLLGGFPAVTGYALLTGAAFLAVRLLAGRPRQWWRVTGAAAAALGGVLTGVALSAWQLLPWIEQMSGAVLQDRGQDPSQHITPAALVTVVAPQALGTSDPTDPPTWFAGGVLIEHNAYVGAAAVVLVVTALILARAGRTLLPRGLWWFFVTSSAAWGVVIFFGGPPLAALQQTGPLFSDNFIGRGRSVLGFLLAVLAAVGFHLLQHRRHDAATHGGSDWRRRAYAAAVCAVATCAGAAAYVVVRVWAAGLDAQRVASGLNPRHLAQVDSEMAVGLGLVAAAAVCAAWLWWAPRTTKWLRAAGLGVTVLIPILVAGQALVWAKAELPRSAVRNFYPTTATHDYLAGHLGHQRYFGAAAASYGSVEAIHGLRGFGGHSFVQRSYAELVEALPGQQFWAPPKPATLVLATPDPAVALSPILDRASVSHFLAPPNLRPIGVATTDAGDGTQVTLLPERPVTVAVPSAGPLRGVGVTPRSPGLTSTLTTRLEVTVRDATGRVVANAERTDRGIAADEPFFVPLAAEAVGSTDRLTAEIVVHGPRALTVAARAGSAALSVVAATDDGLRLVDDGPAVIYQRTKALARARWAASTMVVPDPERRLALLAGGAVPADAALLNEPGSRTDGQPAQVEWITDGLAEMAVRVSASGAGYLVLADAVQTGWRATIDGAPATIVAADHAFAAVAVPPGVHVVRFSYDGAARTAGVWVSVATLLVLVLAVVAAETVRRRRRPSAASGA